MRLRPRLLGFVALGIVAVARLPAAAAQEQAKPYMLLILDTSGSMDGSPLANAKGALADVVNASGEVVWGLQRFGQICDPGATCDCARSASDTSCRTGGCDGEAPIVPLDPENQAEVLGWVDGTCDFAGGNPELVIPTGGTAWTPLAASLDAALAYYNTVIPTDPFFGCRPYFTILLTDGQETCCGDPEASAAALLGVGIRTLVIGFGVAPGDPEATSLNAIAIEGGTGPTAVYVEADRTELALALLEVIEDSVLFERCNDRDDDCDCPGDTNGDCPGDTNNDGTVCGPGDDGVCAPGDEGVDEGYDLGAPCDNGLSGVCYAEGATVCTPDGVDVECDATALSPPEDPELTCDALDNDCDCPGDTNGDGCVCCAGDFNVDEGLTNACGGCGPVPAEVCDWLDNDCNGTVDDVTGIGELCPDPDAPGPIGDEGVCELGELECQGEGPLACFGAVGPAGEVCDCLDNDCDGSIDEPPGTGEPALCPPGSECIDCWCVSPCGGGEFNCPSGYECDGGVCIPGECTRAQCPAGLYCVLDEFCQGNACTGACAGACALDQYCHLSDAECYEVPCVDLCGRCQPDQVCDDGRCFDDNCYNFPEECGQGEICLDAACVANPCAGVQCGQYQFCRDGECVASCAYVNCGRDEICRDGTCHEDPCSGVACPGGQVCDDGSCVSDPCAGVDCGPGRACRAGTCIDDLCRYIHCPQGSVCEVDACVAPVERSWVLTAGGGGCACDAHGDRTGPSRGGFALFALTALLGALLFRRRRAALARGARRSDIAVTTTVTLALLLIATGCDLDAECVDCHECVPSNGGFEVCDWVDNDCDCPGDTNGDGWYCGAGDEGVDEDFDLDTDVGNCGMCGRACDLDNAHAVCAIGACQVESCVAGFYDNNANPADGCEYGCLPTNDSVEVCDGLDNDCDCPGDTNDDECTCCPGDDNVDEPAEIAAVGLACGSDVGECSAGETACPAGELICDGEEAPALEICDGLDNDCDDSADEDFPAHGQPCSRGVGVCRVDGTVGCNDAQDGVWCACTSVIGGGVCDAVGDPVPVDGDLSRIGSEEWNELDDDCNSLVDDGIATAEAMTHVAYTHPVYGDLDFWIYTHEASRPDATDTSAGHIESAPQSVANVLPWSSATWQEAHDACAAVGRRLCTEAEWQAACESDELRQWPYADAYVPNHCNDNLFDFDAGTPEDEDGLLPTAQRSDCVTKDGVFDMSGNLKEWTDTQVSTDPSAWRIRGGAFDSPPDGTQCGFDFGAGNETYLFDNLGFRCCSDTGP